MLYVVVFAVLVFLGGIGVIAVMALRTVRLVKEHSRAIAAASERIADAASALEAVNVQTVRERRPNTR